MSEELTVAAPVLEDDQGDIIQIVQLPIIKERLHHLKTFVEEKTSAALALICTDETLQTVKQARADLNALFKEAEEQRKAVKNAVMQPYQDFEAVYKECVSDLFKAADAALKEKASAVEAGMKAACEQRLRGFFDELVQANHIDFLRYEQAGIVISMADARAKTQPPKKLREQLEQFVLRVVQDVEMIATLEDAGEVMSVYKQTLNATQAISTVNERHRQIEQARAEQEARAAAKVQEAEVVRKVEAFAPPVTSAEPTPAPAQDEKLSCTFTVIDTKDRLILLKRFLDANGYQYT